MNKYPFDPQYSKYQYTGNEKNTYKGQTKHAIITFKDSPQSYHAVNINIYTISITCAYEVFISHNKKYN